MRTLPVFTCVLLAACGEDATELTATARVEGSFVLVEATCPGATDVEVAPFALRDDCSFDNPARFRIPAAQLGAGAKKLTVTGVMKNHKPTAIEVSVDVPDAALAPYLLVDRCGRDAGRSESLTLEGGGRATSCDTFGGARVKLLGRASPNGKLSIGGKTIEIPASGELAAVVELTDAILGLTIDELVDRHGDPKLALPWKLEAKGKTAEGKLSLRASYGNSRHVFAAWLRDVASGKVDRPAFVARPGRKTVVRISRGDLADLSASDRRGTVREVALIVVERELGRAKDGTCEFETNGRVTRATRYGIDLELVATSTLDGTTVATKAFKSEGGCPSFAMLDPANPVVAVGVSEQTITAWLDEISG
ncbi:MAG: hypothetical protein KIT31_02725 [Deltaproteobacteria bacterium]|nr:hypothetical protein [Deltaproteobacteria bacterium]